MGSSNCGDTSGPDTFSTNTRFLIPGNDWVIMNLKFKNTDYNRAFDISGARNWIYNNRIGMAGNVQFDPRYSSDTSGNRVIGNYLNGGGNDSGVAMLNPFMIKDNPSVIDLVIGGNTFENFVEPTYGPKVIVDVTWGWNYPYGSSTDIPGAETFTELAWNHFIDSHGEIPTSKTSRWMIHDNLYEHTSAYRGADTPHISLRGGDDKLVFRNIILDGNSRVAQKSVEIKGARSQGYYNASYRSGSVGLGLTWTAIESFDHYPTPDKTFYRNEVVEDIDWRYNFFLGDGGDSTVWARVGVLGGAAVLDLPPRNNTIKDNFYSAENPTNIKFAFEEKRGLTESDWIKYNPNAVASLQHFATRSGNKSTLKNDVTIPESITVKDFWIGGEDIIINLPPWISPQSDSLIVLGQ